LTLASVISLPEGISGKPSAHLGKVHYNPKVNLSLGAASWDSILGPYYVDMRPALLDYAEFRYGDFDSKGLPMVGYGTKAEYFCINLAQFGFAIHDVWWHDRGQVEYRKKLDTLLDWFESNKERTEKGTCWRIPFPNEKYGIPAGYTSAMAQGEIISFYTRMYQLTGKQELLSTAMEAFDFLKLEVTEGGVRRQDKQGRIWLEEFPLSTPSYVLNGFIYTLFGLVDLFRVSNNQHVKAEIDLCLVSLKHYLPQFSLWYWPIYDLKRKELIMTYYLRNVYIPQMQALCCLFPEEPLFAETVKRWKRQNTLLNRIFVQVMYRLQPRIHRLFNKKNEDLGLGL
jgi:heparosan-N-sulfate-glucuronate 5-epimerase